MEGYEVKNEKGERAWWDGKSLIPIKPGDTHNKFMGEASAASDKVAEDFNRAKADPKASLMSSGDDIMKKGQQMAWEDAKKGSGILAKNVLVPIAEAGIGAASGGLGLLAQSGIGLGTEAVAQATGTKPQSTSELVLSALGPGAGRLVSKIPRAAGRLVGSATVPTETVAQIGKEAVAARLGAAPDVLERAATRPVSDELYAQARGAGNVATGGMKSTVDDALKKELARSTPDKATVKRLTNLSEKLAANPDLDAGEVVNELQDLGAATTQAFKKGQSVRGTHLKEATGGAKGAVGKDIPALAEADAAYSRERATKDVLNAIGKSNPVKSLDDLLEKSGPQMLKVMSKEELQDVRDIAGRIGRSVASEGFFNRMHEGGKQMLSEMLGSSAGRSILRKTMGPEGALTGKRAGASIGAAFTFWRAYKAYEKDQPQP